MKLERTNFDLPQDQSLLIASVRPRFKVHYAPYGEVGGERVNCGKYYTTDVAHTGNRDKVTCKLCQRLFK